MDVQEAITAASQQLRIQLKDKQSQAVSEFRSGREFFEEGKYDSLYKSFECHHD